MLRSRPGRQGWPVLFCRQTLLVVIVQHGEQRAHSREAISSVTVTACIPHYDDLFMDSLTSCHARHDLACQSGCPPGCQPGLTGRGDSDRKYRRCPIREHYVVSRPWFVSCAAPGGPRIETLDEPRDQID